MLLGGYLSLWIGPTVPFPAPPILLDWLEQVTVSHNEGGRSGFQATFAVGRNRTLGLVDYPPLLTQLVRIGHRVQFHVLLGARPTTLMDGIITSYQLSPGSEPNSSKLTILGEDVSVMMGLKEKQRFFNGMSDDLIAYQILAEYATWSIVPFVVIPPNPPPMPTERTPHRNGTDLAILEEIATTYKAVFYIDSMTIPGVNRAYLGPPERAGAPQRALTFDMGADTNLTSISFNNDGTKPHFIEGVVQPTRPDSKAPPLPPVPVYAPPLPLPPLAALPALAGNAPFVASKLVVDQEGGDLAKVLADAFTGAASSTRSAVTASGEVDVARYGGILKPRSVVAVRGVGLTFDGLWYVKSVTHNVSRGGYKQQFSLERDGTMPISPVVPP